MRGLSALLPDLQVSAFNRQMPRADGANERDHRSLQPVQVESEAKQASRPRGGERENMTKEERDALREKCMKGLETHTDGYALCRQCPYEGAASCNCSRLMLIDALSLLRDPQPDDQPRETPNPFNITLIPEPDPLDIEIVGARICGKYVKIGITPDELEIQIPGMIAPHEFPALVDELNRALEFAQRNKMVEVETNEHD